RALLSLDSTEEQLRLAKEIIEKALNVRETERLVKDAQVLNTGETADRPLAVKQRDPNIAAAEQKLSKAMGAPARIKFLKEGGVLEIKFSSSEDLSRLFDLLIQRNNL
ncbi:MAG: chromosome partitioning protein ParB, partial [Blastocatellia bacterium]